MQPLGAYDFGSHGQVSGKVTYYACSACLEHWGRREGADGLWQRDKVGSE